MKKDVTKEVKIPFWTNPFIPVAFGIIAIIFELISPSGLFWIALIAIVGRALISDYLQRKADNQVVHQEIEHDKQLQADNEAASATLLAQTEDDKDIL